MATTFEARNLGDQVVRTFSHRDLAEAYAERMSFLGMTVKVTPPPSCDLDSRLRPASGQGQGQGLAQP